MEAQFWHNAWDKGKTGWQQRSVNSRLQRYWPQMGLAADATVFVPLCGDSVDMLWLLEQGHRVIGSELSEAAVQKFFADYFSAGDVAVEKSGNAGHTVYKSGSASIYCGDYFSLSSAQVGRIDAVYDRAATVAMSRDLRLAYANKLQDLLSPGASVMLIAWEYDQEKMDGPPFSVPPGEVERLYAQGFEITTLSTSSGREFLGNLAERGLDTLTENVHRMVRR